MTDDIISIPDSPILSQGEECEEVVDLTNSNALANLEESTGVDVEEIDTHTVVTKKKTAGCDWMFTINNPTKAEEAILEFICRGGMPQVKFLVYQFEKGHQGTIHVQGFIIMRMSRKFSWMKDHLFKDAHWELKRWTRQACINYCSKLDTRVDGPYYYGSVDDVVKVDHSKDWKCIYDMVQSHKTELQIMSEYPGHFFRCQQGIRRGISLVSSQVRRNAKTIVVVFYGASGSGKTTFLHKIVGDQGYYKNQGKWWDLYQQQHIIGIDDFDGCSLDYRTLLNVMDFIPLMVETKGGTTEFVAELIVISSNKHPSKWYREELDSQPIMRRIEVLARFAKEEEINTIPVHSICCANGFKCVVEKGMDKFMELLNKAYPQ